MKGARICREVLSAVAAMCILMMFSGSAFAANVTFSTTGISSIYPQNEGTILITLNTNSAACTNGSSPKFYAIAVGGNGVTADGAKALYATALTAFSTGKPVTIVFDDQYSACYINRIQIHN